MRFFKNTEKKKRHKALFANNFFFSHKKYYLKIRVVGGDIIVLANSALKWCFRGFWASTGVPKGGFGVGIRGSWIF